jgi:hypothetical protein
MGVGVRNKKQGKENRKLENLNTSKNTKAL